MYAFGLITHMRQLTMIADVNTKIDDLKQAVVKMIRAGVPVFFGCDVGQSSDRNFGIMDPKLYKFEVCVTVPIKQHFVHCD